MGAAYMKLHFVITFIKYFFTILFHIFSKILTLYLKFQEAITPETFSQKHVFMSFYNR